MVDLPALSSPKKMIFADFWKKPNHSIPLLKKFTMNITKVYFFFLQIISKTILIGRFILLMGSLGGPVGVPWGPLRSLEGPMCALRVPCVPQKRKISDSTSLLQVSWGHGTGQLVC